MTVASQRINEWANKVCGLKLSPEKLIELNHELPRLLEQFKVSNPEEILNLAHPFTKALIDLLTVQESYFFRDPTLFKYLSGEFLPQLLAEKKRLSQQKLDIWSVGCARGEEIYSIAIILNQLGIDLSDWKINLLGSDINREALAIARKGVYTSTSLRSMPPLTTTTYFRQHKRRFELKDFIKKNAHFEYFNLAKPQYHGQFDIILCRNVFIYLDPNVLISALHFFYESLQEGGLLLLGSADFISQVPHHFQMRYHDIDGQGIYVYQKNFKRATQNNKVLTANLSLSRRSQPIQPILKEKENHCSIEALEILLHNKRFEELLKLAKEVSNPSAKFLRLQGEALIGLNEIIYADEIITKAIQLDSLDPISYFLKGLIAIDMKHKNEAVSFFQKALFLNPFFPEAQFYLALLYLQANNYKQGMHLLKQALKYAEKETKGYIYRQHDSKEQFMQAIRSHIEYYDKDNHGQ